MVKADAVKVVGSELSATSKLPCYSFNLSALHCKTGSKLAKVPGTVCFGCYALKGNYARFLLPDKLKPKTAKIDDPLWVSAMVLLISRQGAKRDKGYFRWHDSGDIQNVEHLQKIVDVCNATPKVKHWLPTREYGIVREYLKGKTFPSNLAVRLSAHKIDQASPDMVGANGSTVTKDSKPIGLNCPANRQEGKCLDCRSCWNNRVKVVSYNYH